MRMRKIPWAKDYIAECDKVVQKPHENQGKWREVLNRDSLRLEIGSGKGDYWIGMSKLYPETAWVGVEKDSSVAALALKKVEGTVMDNALFINSDAQEVDLWFAKGELDAIHLNFSDPWPKKRNSKRRLSHGNFLNKYKELLNDDGEIVMKTDNRKLFEFSLVEFGKNGFELQEVWLDFRSETHDEDQITEYESKFMGLNQPIYRGIWKKEQ